MNSKSKSNLLLGTLLISLLVIFITSCSKDDDFPNEIELTVASKKVMSEDWSGIKKECNVVKEEGGQWQILFSLIPDFQYEDGYEYRLKVRKIVSSPDIMDAYSSYELISQISKEKKATVFQSYSYGVTNNAKAEGKNLTPDEIATIENKIKQSSPFNGVTGLTFEFIDFPVGVTSNRNFIYKTNTEKTGNGNQTTQEKEGKVISIFTFDFDGNQVIYKNTNDSPLYLILDLTSAYKTDYPTLELAQSGIGMKPIL